MPVLSSIVHTLQEKENRAMRSDFFLGIWDDYFPLQEAERQLATTVDWGRYAELFVYDAIEIGSICRADLHPLFTVNTCQR